MGDAAGPALQALAITLQVASGATLLVALPGVALGRLLARRDFRGKSAVETLVALPLVLPPTAVGYLVLRLFARDGPLGREVLGFDPDVLLTRRGAILATAAMALPLVARTARVAFEAVPERLELMALSLGLAPRQVLARVTLPLARGGLLAALLLGFSRALGEFGATVVVAGSIPGRTRTLSIAIFDAIQVGRERLALTLIGVSALLAFATVWGVELLLRRAPRPVR